MTLIFLVLPFVTLVSLQLKDVAAESPIVSILEVENDANYRIDVLVEITLTGFNYDLYTEELRLYLNQSIETILLNNYDEFNATKTFDRQSEATFEANILSPVLGSESASYNVTVLAITNTDEKSTLVQWLGGYIHIDVDVPYIAYIDPSTGLEEIWATYTVTMNISDTSNLSLIEFYINSELRYQIEEPDPAENIFTWNWYTTNDDRGEMEIGVRAVDNSTALNDDLKSFTVTIVGLELTYLEPIPEYIDSNDTLALNVSLIDYSQIKDASPANDIPIDTVLLNYSISGGPWQIVEMENTTTAVDYFNYTFPEYPVGTKIAWEIFANNTDAQYHHFLNADQEPYSIYSVYPDHINPTAEVEHETQFFINEDVVIGLNVTEQSPLTECLIFYKIDSEGWENTSMILDQNSSYGFNDNVWYYYNYSFGTDLPVFTRVTFWVFMNDTGGNSLSLTNSGKYYSLKIIPTDLFAPNVTITVSPETLTTRQNITITVTINETSNLFSVEVLYIVNNVQYAVEMEQTSDDTWTASFVIEAAIGDKVRIWVVAIDEFYNTGMSEVLHYEVETSKVGVSHNNFVMALLLIVLLVAPIVLTILVLRPQR